MKDREQRQAAKNFVQYWQQKAGYEKGETQSFWTMLLREVFGIEEPEKFITFEDQVKVGKTKFIDARILKTRVMIEQKSSDVDLLKPIRQSGGAMLTPYQQARNYVNGLDVDEHPLWIVVCNFNEFHIHDMHTPDDPPVVIKLADLEKEYYRLNFLVKLESAITPKEMELSLKAGEMVGEIHKALLKKYLDQKDPENLKSLNKLCVRLVFCLYAEDAGLFKRHGMFHDYLSQFEPKQMRDALVKLFRILNTKEKDRDPYENADLLEFPYVNGGLFADDKIIIPQITADIAKILLSKASEGFDWSEISPTIFGAVFESTLNPDTRHDGGMHYTSIENIHKVIDPLFLNDLRKELSAILSEKSASHRTRALKAYQEKLAGLRIMDPACGSGNFLTETYICLRRLENDAIRALLGGQSLLGFDENDPVKVQINQFYGIEINDFAVSVAQTALWIAESQMLKETEDIINRNLDFLPLKSYTNIHEGNALRMDWHEVANGAQLSYVIGNPPFLGYSNQNASQKSDICSVYIDEHGQPYKGSGKIDYVAAWYFKAAEFIQSSQETKVAFVATNSITQGEQVSPVWKPLFQRFGIGIDFAYRTFIWDSEAKKKAHVHCVIIGFSNLNSLTTEKRIYDGTTVIKAKTINPYLMNAEVFFIDSRSEPICDVPPVQSGGKPVEGGNLLFTAEEKEEFEKKEPLSSKFFRPFIGSDDFISGKYRYCLWLLEATPAELKAMPKVQERLALVRQFRLNSKKTQTRELASVPYRFMEVKDPKGKFLLIPATSGERREYIPIGFIDNNAIPSNAASFISSADEYLFGVLTSSVHMAWMRAVSGKLKSDYRYSNLIVYNTFPWPEPSEKQKEKIIETAGKILEVRAKYSDSNYEDLYDRLTMPADLLKAHRDNDKAVMEAYGYLSVMSEQEIVIDLVKRYQYLLSKEEINEAIGKVIGKKEEIPSWLKELKEQCLRSEISVEDLIEKGKLLKRELSPKKPRKSVK